MAEYLIQDSTLSGIADAIREKTGGTEQLTPAQMAAEIAGISSGFPNGTEWTAADTSAIGNKTIYYPTYANGIWVATSASEGIRYSVDGKTWEQSNITSDGFNSNMLYANGLWVVGCSNGVYYSTDGMNWTNSNLRYVAVRCVAYSNGVWVAGGTGLKYSTDGKNWTDSNVTSGSVTYATNGNGIWVAGGASIGLYYSTDGINWTKNDTASDFKLLRAVFCNGLWVSGSSNNGIYYSIDAQTWTQSNITSGFFYSAVNANGKWVIEGRDSIAYSIDGKTWTINDLVATGTSGNIVNANGIWVLGCSGDGVYYSTDGVNWTKSSLGSAHWVAYGNGIWVAGNNSTNADAYYSIAWEPN